MVAVRDAIRHLILNTLMMRHFHSDSISNWAITFCISLVALTALLGIHRTCHPNLPKDARTLLRTKTKYSIQERAGRQYHYFGILPSLKNTLCKWVHTLGDTFTLKLQINIDGLPLFKSSCLQLWPIFGLLPSVPMKEPVVIGLFCGSKKPSSAKDFLQDFVTKLKQLEQGFDFEGKKLTLKLDTVTVTHQQEPLLNTQRATMPTMVVTNVCNLVNT